MKKLNFCFLFFGIVMLLSCTSSKKVKIVEKNFIDEVPLAGNLMFTFDQNMVNKETIDRIWDTTEYIKFSPHLPGRFKWETPNKLVFSPILKLKPATIYKAEFQENKFLGNIEFESPVFDFYTMLLNIDNSRAYWALTQNNQVFAHFDVTFNYTINPKDVADFLTIEVDGKPLKLFPVNDNTGKIATFYSKDVVAQDNDIKAKIIVTKGLKTANSSVETSNELTKEVTIPSLYNLKIEKVTTNHDGYTGKITVATSQKASEENLKDFIDIKPSVNFTVEVNDQDFIIKSDDFDVNNDYELSVKKGLKGILKSELKYEYTEILKFGKLKPTISFGSHKGKYLSGEGLRNIEINMIGVDDVKVKITKVYENNIVSYIAKNYYNYYYHDNDYYSDYSAPTPGRLGDVIFEQDYKTGTLPKNGNSRILHLDFKDKINNYNGFYVVEVASKNNYWLSSRKIVSISDIGLIVKEGKESITVFTNSIKTAKPLANVELKFIAENNQVLGKAKTDAQGVATFRKGEYLSDNFNTALITAKLHYDFNYLPYNGTRIGTSRFEIGGRGENLAGYDAFIYGEREIYRPGEKINLAVIIRDNEWNTPGELPVKLKFIAPSGKVYKTIRENLDPEGMFETSLKLPASATTGTYIAEVYTSTDVLLNAKSIMIEEFMPDRIKVKMNIDKKEYKTGEKVIVDVNAMNLFGPPATNRTCEVKMSLKKQYFYAKNYSDYNFSISGTRNYFQNIRQTEKTDENGNAQIQFVIPTSFAYMGLLQADFYATVFDETGRAVNRMTTTKIFTQETFYGIKQLSYYNPIGKRMKIPLIATDKNGKALNNIKAQVLLIKHEYKTVLVKSGSSFRYKSEHEEIILKDEEITINGTSTSFLFTPGESGRYEIRLSVPEVNAFVKEEFYSYGYGRTSYSSFKVNTEGQIDIEPDKEKYKTGETAKIIMKTPFSGKVLVTVENNAVLKNFYLNTDKRAVSFDLKIEEQYVPNIYITATLFKAHTESDLPLTVAHGFVPVLVDNPRNLLPLTIKSGKSSRSKTKQVVTVKGQPNSPVTIAVVDEGILQLTGYSTPDPYNFFYRKRALEVETYNVYPFLFPEIPIKSGKPGGGADFMGKRVNPITNQRVKPVSFWSGIIRTNASGIARYEFEIPQYSGDLRIMAVGNSGKTFGNAESNMKVSDPLVMSVALPRFFSPGDTVDLPVIITNTTKKNTDCRAVVKTTGSVEIIGETNKNINVEAEAENNVTFKIVAKAQIGEAQITVDASAFGEKFSHLTDITVRPSAPLQKINGSGTIEAGKSATITPRTNKFIESSIDRKLIVSTSPLIEFSDDLDYLLRYPYGCVEQTVSAAFPQLYYSDLVSAMYKGKDERNPNYNVQESIRKLMLMQLYNGGLTYWPGHGRESWWGSVYAAHFLHEAKKAGYDVDDVMIDKLMQYLEMKLKRKSTITYYYNNSEKREIANKEIPYSLYVLSLAGRAQISTMNYYKSNLDLLSIDGRYLLAAAYKLAGDNNKYNQVIPKGFSGEIANQAFGGSFYSYIRDLAISLNVVLEADPDNQQIGMMAKLLVNEMKQKHYLNTQERAFAFLALGKIARKAAESDIKASIKSNGKQLSRFNNELIILETKDLPNASIEINTSGKGQLYYFWETEGISKDGSYNKEDSYIKVRKNFYTRDGIKITDNHFKQNDLVVVELTLEGLTGASVENIALTDMLPACFEIENPRLGNNHDMRWIKNKSLPSYTDIRDDRIIYFLNLKGKVTRHYYYIVRAVSTGTFVMGPVGADAMYNGEYHSYHGAGKIIVERN